MVASGRALCGLQEVSVADIGTRPQIRILANGEIATPVVLIRYKGNVKAPRHELLWIEHQAPPDRAFPQHPQLGRWRMPSRSTWERPPAHTLGRVGEPERIRTSPCPSTPAGQPGAPGQESVAVRPRPVQNRAPDEKFPGGNTRCPPAGPHHWPPG